MSDNSENVNTGPGKNTDIYFNCKYCGEKRPLGQLVVMREFYPPISVCQDCAKFSSSDN